MSSNQVDSLIEETRRMYPVEVCGALFGSVAGDIAVVERVVYMKNILNSEFSFQIDPEEFLSEMAKSEGEGLKHIGFFHSHPRDAKPSPIDLEYMKLWPGSIWLIISSLNFNMAAYRMLDNELQEVPVEIR